MPNQFYKGRTNNHLTWVMVDATDFATPESALSGAMTIKIYGKLRGATGTNFVSSGTGSLTNDITHVGASATGTYTIALAKADLSDASAAWYDQYTIILAGTGAAQQVLVVDGGIDASAILAMSDMLSDTNSKLVIMSGILSDVTSNVTRVFTIVSDLDSNFQSRVPKIVASQSLLSDVHSDLRSLLGGTFPTSSDIASVVWTNTAGLAAASRILQIRNQVSDLQSDFQSRVPKAVATNSQLSDLHSDLKSYLAVMSNIQSDIYSLLSDVNSNFGSRIPKLVATSSQLSDLHSDLRSQIAAVDLGTISGILSDIYSAVSNINSIASASPTASDIASKVWADTTGAAVSSRMLQVRNLTSDLDSNFQSRVPKRVATDSQLSDLASDLKSYLLIMSGVLSDVRSGVSDMHSDIASKLGGTFPTASDIASVVWTNTPGAAVASRVVQIRTITSNLESEFLSRVPKLVATNSQLSDLHSDLKSAIGGITVSIDSAAISDIVSAIAVLGIPSASDIASVVWTNTPGTAAASRILQIRNQVSDLQSDFQSRVPKAVATQSGVSDLASDLKSYLAVMSGVQSDIYSLVSDFESNFGSRVPKLVATNSQLSDLASDVKSAVTATASDVKSAVTATASDTKSAVSVGNSRVLALSDAASNIYSRVIAGVELSSDALSNVVSQVRAAAIADPFHANVREVNSTSLVGDGNITPWGPE